METLSAAQLVCRWQLNEAKVAPATSRLMLHRVAADELPATLSNCMSVSLSVCLASCVALAKYRAKVAVKS